MQFGQDRVLRVPGYVIKEDFPAEGSSEGMERQVFF